jgi:hypothetical protein
MKVFLILWVTPIVLLGGWYGLSYYDMNFGFRILSRDLHDLVFTIYGNLLGMKPESIPPLVLKAIILDTFLVIGFIVIKRRRKQIWAASQDASGWTKAAKTRLTGIKVPKRVFTDVLNRTLPRAQSGSRSSAPCRMKLAAAESIRPALLARHIHFDQRPFRGHGRQPLVPEHEGKVGFLRHVAHECARGLRPGPFAAVHVDRQADHRRTHLDRASSAASSAMASSVNFGAGSLGRGEASERDRSETASPMVLVPRSSRRWSARAMVCSSSSMVDGRHFQKLRLCATASAGLDRKNRV